jgi:hypothetical protein
MHCPAPMLRVMESSRRPAGGGGLGACATVALSDGFKFCCTASGRVTGPGLARAPGPWRTSSEITATLPPGQSHGHGCRDCQAAAAGQPGRADSVAMIRVIMAWHGHPGPARLPGRQPRKAV